MKAALFATVFALMSFQQVALAADDAVESSTATPAAPKPGIDVHTIIASVSQRAHKKFIIDPRIAANVQLDGISVPDVTYPLLLTILAVHGFAVYEHDGVIVITPDANERFFPSSVVKPDDIRAPDAEVVTTIIVLKNVKAAELTPILRPLIALNAQINALPDRNAIVLVDRAANVRHLVTIVRELDRLPVFKTE